MSYTNTDRTLALAGVFQAASLVQQVARKGMADSQALEASIGSIFKREAESVESVYGSARALTLGLQSLQAQLARRTATRNLELTKYVLGTLYLGRQLAKRAQMLERIGAGIEKARVQAQYFSPIHPTIITSLAEIYSDTISTLTPRILVNGERHYLASPESANKIRSLLLAAIRSAVLWRQCGGNRLTLLFARGAIAREVESLLGKQS